MNEFQETYALLSNASFEQVLGTLPMLFTFLIVGGVPIYWLMKRQYKKAKEIFEEYNPELKGKYFTFREWFRATNEDGHISNKKYNKKFATNVKVTNTDTFTHSMNRLINRNKRKVKLGRIVILLMIVSAGAYAFYLSDPETSKKFWKSMQEINQRAKQN